MKAETGILIAVGAGLSMPVREIQMRVGGGMKAEIMQMPTGKDRPKIGKFSCHQNWQNVYTESALPEFLLEQVLQSPTLKKFNSTRRMLSLHKNGQVAIF